MTVTRKLSLLHKSTWILVGLGVAISVGGAIYVMSSIEDKNTSSAPVEDPMDNIPGMEELERMNESIPSRGATPSPAIEDDSDLEIEEEPMDPGGAAEPTPTVPVLDDRALEALDKAYSALPKDKRMTFIRNLPREHRRALREYWKKK